MMIWPHFVALMFKGRLFKYIYFLIYIYHLDFRPRLDTCG